MKTILLALSTLCFVSCSPTIAKESDMNALSTHGMVKQQFQNHSYIVTKGPISPVHNMHDPDCPCNQRPLARDTVTAPPAFPVPTPGAPRAPYVPQDIELEVQHPLTSTLRISKPVVTLVKPALPTSVER